MIQLLIGAAVGIVVAVPATLLFVIVKMGREDGEMRQVLKFLREHYPERYTLIGLANHVGIKQRRVGAILCMLGELHLVERETNPLRFYFPWRRP